MMAVGSAVLGNLFLSPHFPHWRLRALWRYWQQQSRQNRRLRQIDELLRHVVMEWLQRVLWGWQKVLQKAGLDTAVVSCVRFPSDIQSQAYQCEAMLSQRQLGTKRKCHFQCYVKSFHAWRALSRSQRAAKPLSKASWERKSLNRPLKTWNSLNLQSPDSNLNIGHWVLCFWHLTTCLTTCCSAKSLQTLAASLRLQQRAAAHFLAVARQDDLSSKCQLQVFKAWRRSCCFSEKKCTAFEAPNGREGLVITCYYYQL